MLNGRQTVQKRSTSWSWLPDMLQAGQWYRTSRIRLPLLTLIIPYSSSHPNSYLSQHLIQGEAAIRAGSTSTPLTDGIQGRGEPALQSGGCKHNDHGIIRAQMFVQFHCLFRQAVTQLMPGACIKAVSC